MFTSAFVLSSIPVGKFSLLFLCPNPAFPPKSTYGSICESVLCQPALHFYLYLLPHLLRLYKSITQFHVDHMYSLKSSVFFKGSFPLDWRVALVVFAFFI